MAIPLSQVLQEEEEKKPQSIEPEKTTNKVQTFEQAFGDLSVSDIIAGKKK
ncbi:MAG: hypothetical protein VW810_03710 [Pelagibacteraceae bacterium]